MRNPDIRIVLAGFGDDDYETPLLDAGWRAMPWFRAGLLKGGYSRSNNQQHRERLWLSPHCIKQTNQLELFT